MGNTITVRLPAELADWLRDTARKTGVPQGRIVREQLETNLSQEITPTKNQQLSQRQERNQDREPVRNRDSIQQLPPRLNNLAIDTQGINWDWVLVPSTEY